MGADDENIPWRTYQGPGGRDVPFYVVQFDRDGGCTSPRSQRAAVEASRDATDVFLFSHGWNNDWAAATARYERFAAAFGRLRRARWDPPDREYAPVLVGVHWPSTALVAPWERGPDIAATDPETAQVRELLAAEDRARFDDLVARPDLDDDGVLELAGLLAPVLPDGSEERGEVSPPATAEELVGVWRAIEQASPEAVTVPPAAAGGFIPEDGGGTPGAATAGFNPLDLVRKGIRLATVLQMKDRAGRVGGHGVADLLRELTADDDGARVHLVGHSYGAKVVLSALCNGPAPGRPVDSVLLLQPALSCYAFTADLEGHPGGYRSALERSRQPVLTTWSPHDVPLTRFFHLAARRASDLAEAQIAGAPPSKFAALGGYGPQGVAAEEVTPMPDVGQSYPLDTTHRVVGVDGAAFIPGHGEVESPQTAWALLCQVRG